MSAAQPFDITWASLPQDEAERLYEHYPKLGRSSDFFCPTCDKSGSYRLPDATVVTCDCQQQLNLHKHYLAAGIGITYQRLGWSDLRDADVVRQIKAFVDAEDRYLKRGIGLLFSGPFGVGKTMAANLALKHFVRQGYRCWATTFAETVDSFTAGWRSPEHRRWFEHKFISSDVVLLDDVGRELRSRTQLSETTLDLILRSRVRDGRSTLLTTNMDPGELSSGYGGAIFSLLREKSVLITIQGDDYRTAANSRELDDIAAGVMRPIQ